RREKRCVMCSEPENSSPGGSSCPKFVALSGWGARRRNVFSARPVYRANHHFTGEFGCQPARPSRVGDRLAQKRSLRMFRRFATLSSAVLVTSIAVAAYAKLKELDADSIINVEGSAIGMTIPGSTKDFSFSDTGDSYR